MSNNPNYLVPYSLGDAIDWKQISTIDTSQPLIFPYSLGDAIDWKLKSITGSGNITITDPLLARGRDRLETRCGLIVRSYSLSPLLARGRDRLETALAALALAINWSPLLARGRDRLETPNSKGELTSWSASPTR